MQAMFNRSNQQYQSAFIQRGSDQPEWRTGGAAKKASPDSLRKGMDGISSIFQCTWTLNRCPPEGSQVRYTA
jgi:hypothetical protein